ncbi:FIMAH domain-containing protein [Sporosarcina sp. NPDC096371]|uniref:FIMAH domain-containing protein n=1 Tax=Sporosarcina sp. NPDC096371 TaxID=3364530 RepID=UPI003822C0F0
MKRFKTQALFFVIVFGILLYVFESPFAQAKDMNMTSAVGTSYYIDETNGNDISDGTSPKSAWKSLDKVNSFTFLPGDQILFKAGEEWSGQLHPKGSGTEAKPIRIGKYGEGEKPLIQGEGTVESVVYLYNQEYWEIGYLEITNYSSTPADSPRRGIHVEAGDVEVDSTNDLNKVSTLNHIYIHDLYIHDVNGEDKKDGGGSAGIQISVTISSLDDNSTPDPESVHRRTTFNDVLIENNVIERVSRSGIITWTDWKSRKELGQGKTYGDEEYTPWTPLTNVVIRANELFEIGGDGIVPHMTEGALVEYNRVDGFNKTSSGYNVGAWTWNGDNTLYQYNEVSGGFSIRDGNAFDFDHGSKGVIYQYNYSHDNEGGTLLLCADGSTGTGGVYDGIFRYNISENDHYQTFIICGADNVHNIQIYNNVFYVGPGIKTNMLVSQGGKTEAVLRNNIFYNFGSGGYVKKSSWSYDNNLFFGNKVPTKSIIPDDNMKTFDPLFVNPGSGGIGLDTLDGYKLQVDSPAIGSGSLINNKGDVDFWGNPLSPINQNIGAYDRPAASISLIRDTIEFYRNSADIQQPLYQQLQLHLTAVGHYEEQKATEKVVKHMNSFKVLLDYQHGKGLITEKAYDVLMTHADAMIEKWE